MNYRLLSETQFGFRKRHLTVHAVLNLSDIVNTALDNNYGRKLSIFQPNESSLKLIRVLKKKTSLFCLFVTVPF